MPVDVTVWRIEPPRDRLPLPALLVFVLLVFPLISTEIRPAGILPKSPHCRAGRTQSPTLVRARSSRPSCGARSSRPPYGCEPIVGVGGLQGWRRGERRLGQIAGWPRTSEVTTTKVALVSGSGCLDRRCAPSAPCRWDGVHTSLEIAVSIPRHQDQQRQTGRSTTDRTEFSAPSN
jgi:hypothetical protein